ncbi:thioesterase [Actinokineospora fastidiosa]|uniref:Thioesterase n=1 Tax=Actinokineospora fastidiosa TaxID=1816 RepID=A0A918GP37_9PSEU|nr:thioesterase [Actinokineospora fastidiosa]
MGYECHKEKGVSVTQPPTAVLLPGTGSDEIFVRSVFEVPVSALGARLLPPAPVPGTGLAEAYLTCLDAAARTAPVIAGGISFGAHLAAAWAVRNPTRCAGLLLALPAWEGEPDGAPAAVAARHSAADIRARGTAAALASAIEGTPEWLATELSRAWPRYGDGLAASLETAAAYPAPTLAELKTLDIPAGVTCFVGDPIHPESVAQSWADALPRAVLTAVRLEVMGADVEALGRATVLALLRSLAG